MGILSYDRSELNKQYFLKLSIHQPCKIKIEMARYFFWEYCFYDFNQSVCLMVFNATFNNISVISWRSVLLVEETGGPWENHWPVASHWQTLSHNVVHFALIEIRTHNISGDRNRLHSPSTNQKPVYHVVVAI